MLKKRLIVTREEIEDFLERTQMGDYEITVQIDRENVRVSTGLDNLFMGAPVMIKDKTDDYWTHAYYYDNGMVYSAGDSSWTSIETMTHTPNKIKLPSIVESPLNTWLAVPSDLQSRCPAGAENLPILVWIKDSELPQAFSKPGKDWGWRELNKFMILGAI